VDGNFIKHVLITADSRLDVDTVIDVAAFIVVIEA
jgi:hypothetical protein